ncbi:MAG: hypothetical protein DHS20C18_15610 [Saprospiraceae bacterium]|nr:MAG: hypothetical protein DHS20C18_15610 [Saprospiraceae bacterium]
MIHCYQCGIELPDNAKFCWNCGASQEGAASKNNAEPLIDWGGDAKQKIKELFFSQLKKRIEEEQGIKSSQEYSEHVYESGFRDVLERRVNQFMNQTDQIRLSGSLAIQKMDQKARFLLDELLDFYLIKHCKTLNKILLPEAILSYHNFTKLEQVDLRKMILDFLDFNQEEETIYTDFLVMPIDKLKNAGKAFLFPETQERILLICDQSIMGSCKEGFALTEKGIYWKAHLQKAKKVAYHNLAEVNRVEDWITINTQFFNVTPSINVKMMKLLRKIIRLQEEMI